MVQNRNTRQWAVQIVLSLCGAFALTARFATSELSEEQQANVLSSILWGIRGSLSGTGVTATLLFSGLVALGVLVHRMRRDVRPPRALLPASFLIALVWLMGAAFSVDDTLGALTAGPGGVVRSICYVLGSTWLLYLLGQLLFFFLARQVPAKRDAHGRLGQWYQRHPFGATLLAILLFWTPHLVISYPGYMCYDTWRQLAEYFGVLEFTAHHPPIHTLFLGAFAQLGLHVGNASLGLYLSIVIQALIAAGILAYTLVLMQEWETPGWLRIGSFCVIVVCPYYTAYMPLALKDDLYAVFFTLFVAECVCMLKDPRTCLDQWRHKLLLSLSIMGTLLFRNNGKYVLYPTLLVLFIYFWSLWRKTGRKKDLCRLAACLLLPILLANMLTAAVSAHYGIQKGSIAEALSFPFQQTARYVSERPEEVTEEERQAIQAVLDYDLLARRYDPRISDPVKALYQEKATGADLVHYFGAWFKMFWKHPDIYVKATADQNYYLVYPFTKNEALYSNAFPDARFVEPTNEILQIVEPDSLAGWKTTAHGLYRLLFSLPVIGLLSHPATYGLLLIVLFLFAVAQKRWRWLIVSMPSVMSVIVIILAPVIQGHPRYAFPYIYAMPLMLAYYICLGWTEGEDRRLFKKKQRRSKR